MISNTEAIPVEPRSAIDSACITSRPARIRALMFINETRKLLATTEDRRHGTQVAPAFLRSATLDPVTRSQIIDFIESQTLHIARISSGIEVDYVLEWNEGEATFVIARAPID